MGEVNGVSVEVIWETADMPPPDSQRVGMEHLVDEGWHFRKPPNFQQILYPSPHTTASGSLPCNRTCCKTCSIHIPTQSFTSPNTGLTYHITTLADCKSSNLIYQGNRSDAQHVIGHRSTCTVVNSDLPVPIHIQSHLLQ